MSQTRRLAAIRAADVAGYSRLMGADEEGPPARLKARRSGSSIRRSPSNHGRIVKATSGGNGLVFLTVVNVSR